MSATRIELRRSGGFAGAAGARTVSVDATSLSSADRASLDRAVRDAKLDALPDRVATLRAMPDARQYRLTVSGDAGERTIVVDEQAADDALTKLIDLVEQLGAR